MMSAGDSVTDFLLSSVPHCGHANVLYLFEFYIQVGKLEEACRWFVTYQYFNPEDKRVDENLRYYESLGLDKSFFLRLETLFYKDLYLEGMALYDEQRWSEAVDKFELSLRDFYSKLDECYITCEAVSSTDELVEAEYYSLLTEMFMSSLKCRTKCINKLDSFRLNTDENILSSYLQYLQYSYFKSQLQ